MEKEAEKFLLAEKIASELVETLKKLRDEATSYKTAGVELQAVRNNLIKLIESTEKTAYNTYKATELLKEIGTAEILERINKLNSNTDLQFSQFSAKMKELNKKTEEGIDQLKVSLNKLSKLINYTLAISLTAALLVLILLLR